MITLLHTSDWHLGQTFFGYDREKEHRHFLNWLVNVLVKEQIDVLLIAGDIFDVPNPSASAQKMFYTFLNAVTTQLPKLQIVAIAGNHDSPSRLEAPLPLVADKNITIKGVITKVLGEIQYDDLILPLYNNNGEEEAYCLMVPYLRQGDYPRVQSKNPYAAGVTELYQQLYNRVELLSQGKVGIVAMGHLQAIGCEIAENDYSEKMIIGGLEAVSPTIFDKFDYTALGHIHKSQRLNKNDTIRYAGSPLPMSFAEKNYKHGVVKVVLDKGITQSIAKIDYDPIAMLISIPEEGKVSASEALELLQNLPDTSADSNKEDFPYVEVKVNLTEPDPLLPKQIADIIDSKAVKLTRIINDYSRNKLDNDDELENRELSMLTPLDIANRFYQNKYGEEMSVELKQMFEEVCTHIYKEDL